MKRGGEGDQVTAAVRDTSSVPHLLQGHHAQLQLQWQGAKPQGPGWHVVRLMVKGMAMVMVMALAMVSGCGCGDGVGTVAAMAGVMANGMVMDW